MPRRADIESVLIIGSGPIVIGQAAEFDYAGSQACLAAREEGVRVVLVNNNPATIMTDKEMADVVYLEPLTVESLEKIIQREKPDGLIPTLGGQTGLNLAVQLAEMGVLEKYHCRLLGTPVESIQYAEDREKFKCLMEKIGEPIPQSVTVRSVEEAEEFAKLRGFPLIVRPAYTLGGTGGGVAYTLEELQLIVSVGLSYSLVHQVLVEEYLEGWMEVEYEVMRDGGDNCIIVCNMENVDPMGVHTGDSIVVAPSQTLTDKMYHRLRRASIRIIRALGVEGGCNIQFAVDMEQKTYRVIEVNPRVSRSSALASKATGYPIARVATKIALGYRLDEIPNRVTGKTKAAFEPALDYIVVKIPRFPFDKFPTADRTIGTQMKATGEVMAIGRTLEEALNKAVCSLELGLFGLYHPQCATWDEEKLLQSIRIPDDLRLFAIAEAFRRGIPLDEVRRRSHIAPFFLEKIQSLVEKEKEVKTAPLTRDNIREWKRDGFSDAMIAFLRGVPEQEIREMRKRYGISAQYKMVDTCAGEFEAETPYFYSTYEPHGDEVLTDENSVLVVGSGPIRIGQGIEFDYCAVQGVKSLSKRGYRTIMVNNNPETVSTDFDISDGLFFEPLTAEYVLEVVEKTEPLGIILQFGGQTPLNMAKELYRNGVNILGSSQQTIDLAEDREKLFECLKRAGIPRPPGVVLRNREESRKALENLGFPAIIRPSYVLGGRGMEILYTMEDLESYLDEAFSASGENTLWVDRYVPGKELEVDAVSDGEEILIPSVMEHIERAGIHSGDSIAVVPPVSLPRRVQELVAEYTRAIARELRVIGLLNIQFVWDGTVLYVLEVNPRASRTVPFISKACGVPMVEIAVDVMLGKKLRDLSVPTGLLPEMEWYAVKAPVFSFAKLRAAEISLSPEMKSTGEAIGIGRTFAEALWKAFEGMGISLKNLFQGDCLITVADKDKPQAVDIALAFHRLGFPLLSTSGTARFLRKYGVPVLEVKKIHQGEPNLLTHIHSGRVSLLINTVSQDREAEKDGLKIRRACVERSLLCLTSLDTAKVLSELLTLYSSGVLSREPIRLNDLPSLSYQYAPVS
ncbi:MAG: carbamoyl-phosphate synthase large subunit [bacterium JZ-2024 1]